MYNFQEYLSQAVGVLCSKSMDGSDRVKKCTKIFKILVFCNTFILNNGEKLWSTSIFKFERKVHTWKTLIYNLNIPQN